jgi:PST family polysaccharide transporter
MRRKSARSGILWSIVNTNGEQVLSFATFLILARLLAPEDYGVYVLAGSFANFGFFLLQGLSPAIIQRNSISEEHISTAFWTSIATGILLTAAMAGSANWVSLIFGEPLLAPVLRWMSLVCIPMALTSVPMALFRRELRMSTFAARTVVCYVVGAAVSIPMAVDGFGAFALVYGQIAQWITAVIVVGMISAWRPRFRFSVRAFVDLGRFSVHFNAAMIANLITSKVDIWVLGFFLDVRSLGYYALALRLLNAVNAATIQPVLVVALPLLSPLRSMADEFNAQYQRLVIGATSVWLPATVGIGAVSAAVVPIVFGAKWADSVPVIQAMCLSAFTFSLTAFTGEALSAWGRPDLFSQLAILRLATTTAVFLIAAPMGIVAAGLAWSIVPIVILPFYLATMSRVSGFDSRRLIATWSRVAASGGFMFAALLVIQWCDPFGSWTLAAGIATGFACYLFLLDRVMLPGYVVQFIKSFLGTTPIFASRAKR